MKALLILCLLVSPAHAEWITAPPSRCDQIAKSDAELEAAWNRTRAEAGVGSNVERLAALIRADKIQDERIALKERKAASGCSQQ